MFFYYVQTPKIRLNNDKLTHFFPLLDIRLEGKRAVPLKNYPPWSRIQIKGKQSNDTLL